MSFSCVHNTDAPLDKANVSGQHEKTANTMVIGFAESLRGCDAVPLVWVLCCQSQMCFCVLQHGFPVYFQEILLG